MRTRILAFLLVALVAGALAACGGNDEPATTAEAATTTVVATTTDSETETETETETTGGCESVGAPVPKPDGGGEPPTNALDPARTYSLVVDTNCGSFTIELDQGSAPKTTASLVSLAEEGFFDSTTFHRVVPGFVIQGGDPTGTGTGGPGYSTVDPPPAAAKYTKGVVAMAKTGAEAPGTSGSQFFVVTGTDIGLPPDYAIVGKVTEGLEAVTAIEALGTGDGPPSQPVVIEKVTVDES